MDSPVRPAAMVKGPIRIGVGFRRTVNVVAAGLWATGVLWLVFHYLLRQQGEFGPQSHPLEPWWLRLHGAFGFAALWSLGLLSAAHFLNGWASGRRRWSGASLLALALLLSLTGYLLYYAGDEGARAITAVLHWGMGLAAPLVFVWHRYLRARHWEGERPRAGGKHVSLSEARGIHGNPSFTHTQADKQGGPP